MYGTNVVLRARIPVIQNPIINLRRTWLYYSWKTKLTDINRGWSCLSGEAHRRAHRSTGKAMYCTYNSRGAHTMITCNQQQINRKVTMGNGRQTIDSNSLHKQWSQKWRILLQFVWCKWVLIESVSQPNEISCILCHFTITDGLALNRRWISFYARLRSYT